MTIVEGNSIKDNLYCCGCRACEQKCPNQAISMINDNEGFLKAYINTSECINCGLCKKICPAVSKKNLFPKAKEIFAAIHKQDVVVRRSSSGGMFSAFAQYILENKGSIYGCKLDENLKPIQCRIEDEEELDALRRSKYVQSDTEHTYTQVKQDLSKGKMVLYAGTPCQIAGLRSFLGKPYDRLYCVDLICHGVPSAQLFKQDIEWWSLKLKCPVEKFEFRLKPDYYYYYYFFFIEYSGKTIHRPYFWDPYYEAFYNFKNYNEMCYKCPYACIERTGDITIGDYSWAVDHHPDLCELNAGKSDTISCVLVNSEKGNQLLSAVSSELSLYETKLDWIIERNKNLIRPTHRPKEREHFYSDIKKLGYKKWAERYFFSEAFLRNIPVFSQMIRIKHKLQRKGENV